MFNITDRVIRNIIVPCDHGSMIVNRFDVGNDGVGVGNFLLEHANNNTVEADIAFRVLYGVENPIVFDVGANIGTYASWVAPAIAKANGKVYCFEPQRLIYQMLCGNMAMNNIFNVYAYELALSNEEKYIEIDDIDYASKGSFGSVTLTDLDMSETYKTDPTKKQRIKVTTIDNFVIEHQLPKVDFIKVDAEGLDIEVLEGAKNTIATYSPDLFVEFLNLGPSRTGDTRYEGKDRLEAYLRNLGYDVLLVNHDLFATKRPGLLDKTT